MFTLSWNWLLTPGDRRLIAWAKEQEQDEVKKTNEFIGRLTKIEPETIVSEIERLYQQLEERPSE